MGGVKRGVFFFWGKEEVGGGGCFLGQKGGNGSKNHCLSIPDTKLLAIKAMRL